MGSGGLLPDPALPTRAETIHESERTRVTRLTLPGGTVIRKEPLGSEAERRLRHEMAILERLRGAAGVAQLLEAPQYAGSIVLADAGEASLDGVAKPMAVDDLIGVALELAGAVAGMHRRGVTHGDITPANIVLSREGTPCLVDFALAGSLAEIRPEFMHHAEIVGTLAYLAPEQTGRTGRPVDERADLYALGATLYELAAGEPPFGSGDPLRLVHDHLARVPVPPAQLNPAVPEPLSRIILHLLEKEADSRYQTAGGLAYDLERVRDDRAEPRAAGLRVGGQSGDPPQVRAMVTAGTIDLLGIVSASQALSSETSIGRLHARVVEVLSAMTGATGVRLLLWGEDRHGWLLPAPDGDGDTVPVSRTGHERAVPTSVLRYVQRTREPLVVADAARDDRFARDPYFADVDCCSLMAVPVFSRGALRAVLLLENCLLGGAFTAGRLDAVKLVAGQLAVSLDNAQLYAESRQIAGEQAALRPVAMLVAQAAPPDAVFAAVAAEAGRLLGMDFAVLVRYDTGDAITVVGAWSSTGAAVPTPAGHRLPLGGDNVTTLVFRTGQAARTDYAVHAADVTAALSPRRRWWCLQDSC